MILPDDSKQLFRRPEIWLLKDNVAEFADDMDEICFTITEAGSPHFLVENFVSYQISDEHWFNRWSAGY